MSSKIMPESLYDKSAHLVLRINSLFRSPVGFSYESNLASSQDYYSVGFHNVAVTGFQSNDKFEIANPIPLSGENCKITLKPSSQHVSFSGDIIGALIEVGRPPLTYTRLILGFEVFQRIEQLIVEVRFPNDLRGYASQSEVRVQRGNSEETVRLSNEPLSHHHYFGEKVSHFFLVRNVQPSETTVSVCFRLKPSLIFTLLTPFLFGFLVLLTWLYLPVPFSYQVSITVGLLSLYVSLWFKSQRYVVTSYDNLVNISYITLPFAWFIIVLQSFIMNKQLDVYFVMLYALLVLFVAYSVLRFVAYPVIITPFRKSVDLIYILFYKICGLILRDIVFPSRSEIGQVWDERPSRLTTQESKKKI